MLFRDEKKNREAAKKVAEQRGDGGPGKEIRKRGTLEDQHTTKSTSLKNLKDAIDTFRKGR